jgi:hypothetical protein
MKTYKCWKNFIVVMTSALLAFAPVLECAASEETAWDRNRELSLTLNLKTTSETAAFSIYQVEAWEDEDYRETETFANFSGNARGDNLVQSAKKLKTYIERNEIEPYRYGTTVLGKLKFEHLPAGVYLVMQRDDPANTVTVTESPYLLELPFPKEDGSGYWYDVESLPKYRGRVTSETGDESEIGESKPGGGETEPGGGSESGGGSGTGESKPGGDTDALIASVPTEADGTLIVPSQNRYETISDLPQTVNMDELQSLGDGYYYDPTGDALYYILDEAGPIPHTGDTTIPVTIPALIALLSGTGCIYLYRKRKAYEKE